MFFFEKKNQKTFGRLGFGVTMQTDFTDERLKNPDFASSNQVLRTCVHCGFCTATCPTFVLLGDELDSPRGRIYLMKDMLESGRPATEEVVRHIDRCLSCLSCMTTCPSGVNYMHLVDHARAYIEDTYERPWHDKLLRATLAKILPYPARFRAAMMLAGAAKPFARAIPGKTILAQRLRAMLALAPQRLPPQSTLQTTPLHRAAGERRARVALHIGCAQRVLAPSINEATISLLNRLGIDVVIPPSVGCCGALTHHMGRHDQALATAQAAIEGYAHEIEGEGLDGIIINTSGCGTTVKDYGFMFRASDPKLRDRAEKVSSLALDISEYLQRIGYTPTREKPGLRVAYHSACSLQHGQRVTDAPKTLLRKAGFIVVEPAEPHLCCGSAGTYNLMQPEIAGRLRARKLANLQRTKPDLIAAGNIGCLTQLAGDGIPTVHTVELLEWMAGGKRPAALGAA
jgi:glycolate oxidase iron-sulfur subunit